MPASSLLLWATRKRRLSQTILKSRPLACRRIDIHLTTPLGSSIPRTNSYLAGSMYAPMLVPGGRYFLGMFLGPKESIVCCWDLHSLVSGDGVIQPSASLLLESVTRSNCASRAYPPGLSQQDDSYPFAVQIKSGDIYVLRLLFTTYDPPSLTLAVTLRQPDVYKLKSITGDWVSLQSPWGRPHVRMWNWKTNWLGSFPGWRHFLTPLGLLVVSSTNSRSSQDESTFEVTIKSVAMDSETHPASQQQNEFSNPQIPPIHKLDALSSSTFPLLKTEATIRPDLYLATPPDMTSTAVLHSLDETMFIFETFSPPAANLPKYTIFSIRPNSSVTCLHSSIGERGGQVIVLAALADWLPGLWKWLGPSPQKQNSKNHRVSPTHMTNAFRKVQLLLERKKSASFASSSLQTPNLLPTPLSLELPVLASRIEPQELESTMSLETSNSWSITAKPMGIVSALTPTITFPARTYDGGFRGSELISFCPRSGIWAYQVPMPAMDAFPHAPLASGAYVSFALLIFD
ncbi:hypothetical protein DL93DRAFT_1117044 [Clavulina sp. PMI_390]|nr:hypothetical protein DL93DRAFT_1117044 [Clavulina sp. PMI_390]